MCMSLAMHERVGQCGRGCWTNCCNIVAQCGFVWALRSSLHVWEVGLRVVIKEKIRCGVG